MPPQSTENGQWEVINDFRKGIHEFLSSTYDPGVAQITNTYRCYGQDNGSLAPLPGNVRKIYVDNFTDGTPVIPIAPSSNLVEEFRITGLKASPPVFWPQDQTIGDDQNNTEVWLATEYYVDDGGVFLRQYVNRYLRMRASAPAWDQIWSNSVASSGFDSTHPPRPTPTDFYVGRSNNGDPTQVGAIVMGWSVGNRALFFPDDTNPTSTSTVSLPGDMNTFFAPAHMVTHQGRFVLFPLFFAANGASGRDFYVNTEAFYWSSVNDARTLDPALTGFLNNIVFYEFPTGYGVIESLTANELLLIKAHGGAVILQGDLNNYTARTLPNVRPTGLSQNRGTRTPLGFMYPVENGGIWLWNGSDLAFPLTPQMSQNFWRPPAITPAFGDVRTHSDWGYSTTTCDYVDRFVLFPNNYIYDVDTKALWRLENPDDVTFFFNSTDYRNQLFYCSPSGYRNSSDPAIWEYSTTTPATSYSWQSHPLYKSIDAEFNVMHIGIVAIGEGRVTVTCSSFNSPDGESTEFEVDSSRYPVFKLNNMGVTGTHIVFRIQSEGVDGGPAPTVNELRYYWRESSRVGVERN